MNEFPATVGEFKMEAKAPREPFQLEFEKEWLTLSLTQVP